MLKENKMRKKDYSVAITVSATQKETFKKINTISKWWTEDLEGSPQKLNDHFTVRFGETWITSKVVDMIPDKKIVWLVTDCNKHWLKNKKEWRGTNMNWDISTVDEKTQVTFTHTGL